MVIKCKMCGGDLNIQEGKPICECEFCGTQQTIPQIDNEKKGNLFNRANRLRMGAEFDKAANVYASIVAEFPEEAEAYWGLCLCKYGIEYVDDPLTGNRIPTCHRTMLESIMDDEDFGLACEYADPMARRVYREEAKVIDQIQRDIIAIVSNERPYDVFICYKETAEEGGRTEDSVLAQEIYDALTDKGLKVFFARITLEDKLGQQFEPYIYAALSSAKVMLAVGTKYEHYDAVWVKNEWMRFLSMMKSDKGKALIPCYKAFDAYDMPKEFRNLQGQDMGRLGWLQDLTRGVIKLCKKDEYQQTQEINNTRDSSPTIDSLLRRAMMFVEDGQWTEAKQYADKVLDMEVENGQAYLVKLLADLRVDKESDLGKLQIPFDDNPNYKKIMRFAADEEKTRIRDYATAIRTEKECLDRKIAEVTAEYEHEIQAYEDRQKEIQEQKKRIQWDQKRMKEIKDAIRKYEREAESLVGFFDKKRRNEIQSEIDQLRQQLTALESRNRFELEKNPELFAQDSQSIKKMYYYRLAMVYFETGKYQEAYEYFSKTRGFSDTYTMIRKLSKLIPNVDLDPGVRYIVSRISKYVSAQGMLDELEKLDIPHECNSYIDVKKALEMRARLEKSYGVIHERTMQALSGIHDTTEDIWG